MKANIYKITNNKTEDIYVGSTIQKIKNRFKSHRSNANLNKPGKLYDCMRKNGIEHFKIELLEEIEVESQSEIGQKEIEYCDRLHPSLNMKNPNRIRHRDIGRIYNMYYIHDEAYFYIGSTMKPIDKRLSDHKSASNKGTTPVYTFMNKHGRENFSIKCIEDNVPLSELIVREDYWIKQMNPTLNKNTNLTITEQERDRLKYIKNREKRLKQVSERRLLKRDEINAQKKEHYRKQCEEFAKTDIIPYNENPSFTQEILDKKNLLHLKIIARRFSIGSFPKLKKDLIQKILHQQTLEFPILESYS